MFKIIDAGSSYGGGHGGGNLKSNHFLFWQRNLLRFILQVTQEEVAGRQAVLVDTPEVVDGHQAVVDTQEEAAGHQVVMVGKQQPLRVD